MQIEIHRITTAGFGGPSKSLTNENGQPLITYAKGELLGPVLPHSTIRLRQTNGQVVESPVILRLGVGWCVTAHGCYSIQFLPDVLPKHYADPAWRNRDSFQVSGPTWTDPESVIELFRKLRSKAQHVPGLPLNEAFGYREHFTAALLSEITRHAQQWGQIAQSPVDGFVRALHVAVSTVRFHSLALLGELRSAGPLIILPGKVHLAPIISNAGAAAMSSASLDVIVVTCGGEVIYASRSESSDVTDVDLKRCADWVQTEFLRQRRRRTNCE